MVGGLGKINGQSYMIIGQQKGTNTKTRQYRNFGMANPEGYRKALRLMKMAEKFGIPVVTLVDTPVLIQDLKLKNAGKVRLLQETFSKWFVYKCQLSQLLLVKVLLEVL